MATISNTPRPGYVWDSTDNVWYPIGVGNHNHSEIQNTIIDAKGDLIVGSAADTVIRKAVGTDGQLLYADSTATGGIKWDAAPASGGMTLLSTTTLSGTSTTISSISGSYTNLEIYVYGVTGNVSDNRIRFWFNGNTGGQYQSGTYYDGANSYVGFAADRGNLSIGDTSRTYNNNSFAVTVKNYSSATPLKAMEGFGYCVSSGVAHGVSNWGGLFGSTSAITSVTFDYGGTQSFSGGTVLIYGVK